LLTSVEMSDILNFVAEADRQATKNSKEVYF